MEFVGTNDSTLRAIEDSFNVSISISSDAFNSEGSRKDVQRSISFIDEMIEFMDDGNSLDANTIENFAKTFKNDEDVTVQELLSDRIVIPSNNRIIHPRNQMQREYIREMQKREIVFGIGPAGTGKTFLAMAFAINRFLQKSCSRIILTRPVVEAGENLGFLPGDLHEKLSPFLRPLFDALNDILDIDRVGRLMERGEIEIAPLAYMRGRTLNNAFVILDEAQNTTAEQMKMFLTRIGNGSTAVVTGDITQTDLPGHKKSGLIDASDVLNGISDIGFVKFSSEDVVRTKIVQKIVTAYEKFKK
tara:strand:- start:14996 stop:15904 length:909 start_codon:yes stop_codon:yes gene_type:complete